MLPKVLKEDYAVDFRDYGVITIPKGAKVTNKDAAGRTPGGFYVDELRWIDEKYPGRCEEMKADVLKYGVIIPQDKIILALRIRFVYGDMGYCRDIYENLSKSDRYCRMESRCGKVNWNTLTPEYEEPDCPLRADMLVQVVDIDGKVIIAEQQEIIREEYAAPKLFPFSWEKPATKEEERLMRLVYHLSS